MHGSCIFVHSTSRKNTEESKGNKKSNQQHLPFILLLIFFSDIFFSLHVCHYPSGQGGYVTGLHIDGARWSIAHNSLAMSLPNILTEPLPILAIIPVEEHRLDLQVFYNMHINKFTFTRRTHSTHIYTYIVYK